MSAVLLPLLMRQNGFSACECIVGRRHVQRGLPEFVTSADIGARFEQHGARRAVVYDVTFVLDGRVNVERLIFCRRISLKAVRIASDQSN